MRLTDVVGDNAHITADRRNVFIIRTESKEIETQDVAFAAEILRGLIERLPAHPNTSVTLWVKDWAARQYLLALAGVTASNVGHVAPRPGSYWRGFQSVWKA